MFLPNKIKLQAGSSKSTCKNRFKRQPSFFSFPYTLYSIQQQLLKHHLINLFFPISFIIILVQATIVFFSWTLTHLLPLYNPLFKRSHDNTFYFIEKYYKLSKYKEFYNKCQYTHHPELTS